MTTVLPRTYEHARAHGCGTTLRARPVARQAPRRSYRWGWLLAVACYVAVGLVFAEAWEWHQMRAAERALEMLVGTG